jgi:transaldolase
MKEIEVKFTLFGKNFKTVILAEDKVEAKTKLSELIKERTIIVSTEIIKSDFNEVIDEAENLFRTFGKKHSSNQKRFSDFN